MSLASETPLPYINELPTVGMVVLLQTVQRAQQNQSNGLPWTEKKKQENLMEKDFKRNFSRLIK